VSIQTETAIDDQLPNYPTQFLKWQREIGWEQFWQGCSILGTSVSESTQIPVTELLGTNSTGIYVETLRKLASTMTASDTNGWPPPPPNPSTTPQTLPQTPKEHWYIKTTTGPSRRRIVRTPREVGTTAYAGARTNTPTTTLTVMTTQQQSRHDNWYVKATTGPSRRRILRTPCEAGMTAYAGARTKIPTATPTTTQRQPHHDDR